MSTLTTSRTIDEPTSDPTAASSARQLTPPADLTDAPRARRTPVQQLGRLGRLLVEAASLPSHPYLVSAVGPSGAVLWIENRRLTNAG